MTAFEELEVTKEQMDEALDKYREKLATSYYKRQNCLTD